MKETIKMIFDLGYTQQDIERLENKKEKLEEEENKFLEEFKEWKLIKAIPYKRLILAIHYSRNKKEYRVRLIDYENKLQDYTKFFKDSNALESFLQTMEEENNYINEIDKAHNLQYENSKTREEERIEIC